MIFSVSDSFNIITNSQYAERVVLHIETAEFVPDNSELTLLLRQLQRAMRSGNYALYNTHIWSHTGLPGPMVQDNKEVNQLLIGDVFKASKFHEKHVNGKSLKKTFLSLDNRHRNSKKRKKKHFFENSLKYVFKVLGEIL